MDALDYTTRQEAAEYCPGQWVELTANPGQIDCIVEYDPLMVPPVWLRNDPKPRYPHELRLLARSPINAGLYRGTPLHQERSHPQSKPMFQRH